MIREAIDIRRFNLNRPAFPLVPPIEAQNLLHHGISVIVYAGNQTDTDTVGATVDMVRSAIGLAPHDQNGKLLVVAPNNVASDLERNGMRVFRPESLMQCMDLERIQKDFGVDLKGQDMRSGLSLSAGILFKYLLGGNQPPYNFLVQGKRGINSDFPLHWMAHFAATHQPVAVQDRQWNGSNEALVYSAIPLRGYGERGRELYEAISQGWLGSALVLSTPDALYNSPQATNIRAHDLVLALSATEIARRLNRPLIQLGESHPDPAVYPDLTDNRLNVTQNVLAALTRVLVARNRRISEATAADFREINTILSDASRITGSAAGGILPPPEILKSKGGYFDERATRKLIQAEKGKHWIVPERVDKKKHRKSHENLRNLAIKSKLYPDHDPRILGELLDAIEKRSVELRKGHKVIYYGRQTGKKRVRNIISAVNDNTLRKLYNRLRKLNLYNQPRDHHGQPNPFDITTKDMEPVRVAVEELMHRTKKRIIVPFHGEEDTIKRDLLYCIEAGGHAHEVIASDAGASELATQQARESGAQVINQEEQLAKIDRQKLKQLGITIPEKGSKGYTLFAAIIELERQYQEGIKLKSRLAKGEISEEEYQELEKMTIDDNTMVAFHDSDLKHPEVYSALHYLFIPMLLHRKGFEPRAVHLAKSGKGRNNGPIHSMISDCMNSADPEIRKLGFTMANLVWPLTGERLMRWGDLRKCIWSNGMGIETLLDIQFSAMDAEDGTKLLYQVASQIPKDENAISEEEREKRMIYSLERFFKGIKTMGKMISDSSPTHSRKTLLPHRWSLRQIASANEKFGGQIVSMAFADEETNRTLPNYITAASSDFFVPSVAQLQDNACLVFD